MVTVYFGTNRNLERRRGGRGQPTFGAQFNADGPHAVRFGFAEVEGEAVRSVVVADERLKVDNPARRKLGSRAVFELLRHKMGKHERDTLVFIHGFSNSFESALVRAAELKTLYGRHVGLNVFAFLWPSDGEMVPWQSYYSDRSDARNSGMAMARTFLFLRDYFMELAARDQAFCTQRLHLLAHSMGNYALRHALTGIRKELGEDLPRIFDNIVLAAPDEDNDAFEKEEKFKRLPAICRAVHLYYSPDDRALVISDRTKRNPDRLGSDGPRLLDGLPRKLHLIDCRHVDRSGFAGTDDLSVHQYYRLSEPVVADIAQVLAATPPERVSGRTYTEARRSWVIGAP